MNELSSLEMSQMTMTGTHEVYHACTAPSRLFAQEPDHLTPCNTVESERVLFAQRSTMQKTTGNFT